MIKQPNIITAKRKKDIADPQGDDLSAENYQFSGIGVEGEPPLDWNSDALDKLLTVSKKRNISAFSRHTGDWTTISREKMLFETDIATGSLSSLKSRPNLQLPESEELYVDHQNQEVKLLALRSHISILDDGGIVLRDGYGAEIKLHGGNISISCPGDIILNSARSTISMSGDDTVLKAQNSIDLSATKHDIRLKAWRNAEVAGGLSGQGRTLVENQSQSAPMMRSVQGVEGEDYSSGGLLLVNRLGLIGAYGEQIYLRGIHGKRAEVTPTDGGDDTEDSKPPQPTERSGRGSIILDADQCDSQSGNIIFRSNQLESHTKNGTHFSVGDPRPNNWLSLLNGITRTGPQLEIDGFVVGHNNFYTVGEFIPCKEEDLWLKPDSSGKSRQDYLDEMLDILRDWYYWSEDSFWTADRYGEREMIDLLMFSCRTDSQYSGSRLDWRQPYWMSIYDEEEIEQLDLWHEHVYLYQKAFKQEAYPGYESWAKQKIIDKEPISLFDKEKKQDMPEKPSEEPDVPESPVTPAEHFRVMGTVS